MKILTPLQRLIKRVGANAVSRATGVSRQAVYSWRDGRAQPKREFWAAIVKISDGRVSIADLAKPLR